MIRDDRSIAAHQKARALWGKKKGQDNTETMSEQKKQYQAEMEKMARLKALRLAKEAADKAAAAAAPPRRKGAS